MKKKILIAILVLVLCLSVFVGCKDNTTDGLKTAKDYVRALYRDEATITGSDYQRVTAIAVDGVTYQITWTIAGKDGSAIEAAKIGEVADGKVTITIDTNSLVDVEYVLTATISDANGKTETVSFNYKVPKFEVLSFDAYKATASGDPVAVQGVVTAIISKTKNNASNQLYLNDADGGYLIYNMADDPVTLGVKIGDTILARGTKDLYSGTHEVKDSSIEIISNGSMPAAKDVTELYKAAAAKKEGGDLKDAALNAPQSQLVTIKGVEITDQDTSKGYYKFKLDGMETYVRISSSVCPLTKDEQTAFKAGHTEHTGWIANVTGVICVYDGAFYLTPVTADAFEYVSLPERTPAEQVAYEKDNLTLPTEFIKDTTHTLPTAGKTYADVTIAWDFKAETTHASASIVGDKLQITLQEQAETITLVATLTVGEGETAVTDTKEFAIRVSASAIDWKTAAWAIAECEKLDATSKEISKDFYFIYGEIIDDPTADYCNFHLSDGEKEIVIYGLWTEDGTQRYGSNRDIPELPVAKGDIVYLYAQLQNFGGKLEIVNARLQPTPETGSCAAAAMTPAQAIEECNKLEAGKTSQNKYYITGVIIDEPTSTYCNFNLSDGKTNLLVYGLYDTDGVNRFGSNREIAEIPFGQGYTICIEGKLQKYVKNETTTLEIVDGVLVYYTEPEKQPTAQEIIDAIEMPADAYGDITLSTEATWTVKEGTAIAIEGGVAKVTRGAEDANVILTATVTIGEDVATKDFTIVVKANGAAEPGSSVESALTVAGTYDTFGTLAHQAYSEERVYVKGIVVTKPTFNSQYGSYSCYIADSTAEGAKRVQVYSCVLGDGVTEICENDTIVLYGYIEMFNGMLEVTFKKVDNTTVNGQIVARTAGTSTISYTANENADITLSATSGLNGETFTFTVTAKSGFQVGEVKVNGTVVTAVEGTYTGTIAGNTVVTVETSAAGVVISTLHTVTFLGAEMTTEVNDYLSTWDHTSGGLTVTLVNFNNYKKGWDYVKSGRKNNVADISSISTKTAIANKVTSVVVTVDKVTASAYNEIYLEASANADFTGAIKVSAESIAAGEMTFAIADATENMYYRLVFDCKGGSSNGLIQISQVVFKGIA